MPGFVGIDLGTTFSVVAYINKSGKPEAIRNADGRFITPSVVYFGSDSVLVGDEAKEMQSVGETQVASFYKRNMGNPNFILEFNGKTYLAEDLSALTLKHLKKLAEDHLQEPVTQAVITVPAYFNNMQREATIQAGQKAGLEVLAIINEPTAAALAYGMRPTQGKQTVLVYDLGGGTFDVSIVEISSDQQRVLGVGGDHYLGGKDWDDAIFLYLMNCFHAEFGEELVEDEANALMVLSETIKISLTERTSYKARVQAGGHTGIYTITRDQFEEMTANLMERTQRLTEQTLREIGLSWANIDQVLLIGGSTRMPMVRKYIERMSGKPPITSVNPDEAVALGAAIQAAMEVERRSPSTPVLGLAGRKKTVDVMSHSLGMIAVSKDNQRYVNSILIRKNQPIPCAQTQPYQFAITARRDRSLEVFLTQGESDNPQDCVYLGKYVFTDFPRIENRQAVIDITYAYDSNGVVNISGVERSTRKALALHVEPLPEDVPYRFMQPPQAEARAEFMNLYMAFDLSGSMCGTPLEEARKAAHTFVSQCDLDNVSVGLIAFSDRVELHTKANQNAKEISRGIDRLECGMTGGGNAGDPFDLIYKLLSNAQGKRYAIVLADGVWSHQDVAVKRAKRCHEAGIEIIAVGFGSADRQFLRKISSSDENSFFTDLSHLVETFSNIAQELAEGSDRKGRSGLQLRK